MSDVSKVFQAIVKYAKKYKVTTRQLAYILGTVQRETANTYLPVKEAYWLSEEWRKHNLRYYPAYGRGLVQITWDSNYTKMANIIKKELGIDVYKMGKGKYDWALDLDLSAFILVYGMVFGTFTGRRLGQYIAGETTDYFNARKIVNGLDAAKIIVGYAQEWERKLLAGKVKEFNKEEFVY